MARTIHVSVTPEGDWFVTVRTPAGRELGAIPLDDDLLAFINMLRQQRPTPQDMEWDVTPPSNEAQRKKFWRRIVRLPGFRALVDPSEFGDETVAGE